VDALRKGTEFYEKDNKLRVSIQTDRSSVIDRVATDADKENHAKAYQKFLDSKPKVGRPTKKEAAAK